VAPLCEAGRVHLGPLPALVLRHPPEVAAAARDAGGWVDVDELVAGLRRAGHRVDVDDVRRTVDTDAKGRYEPDGGRIRAAQGYLSAFLR
jgi:putative RNA 2'-phosphotransferase